MWHITQKWSAKEPLFAVVGAHLLIYQKVLKISILTRHHPVSPSPQKKRTKKPAFPTLAQDITVRI